LSSVLAIDLGHPQGRVDALLSLALADGDRGLIIVQSRRVTRITEMEVDRRISPSVISSAALRRLLEAVRSRAN
jgi:hypothetical protein